MDDFALCRRRRYATVLIDADTRERVDVLPDREAHTLETWPREHPGVEVVCRDSSDAYAEAVRRALPAALQVADRWHLWHNLAEAVRKEVTTHSMYWATAGPPPQQGIQAATTRHRWQQIHNQLDKGHRAYSNAPADSTSAPTPSNATPTSANPNAWSAHRSTGPPSSTPTMTTYADAGNKTPPSTLRNSSPRSRN
uniref:transposase n=1 Tax=Salinispora fenicalii TaxID=1137263 RepID=UPI0037CB2ADA